MKKTIYNYFFYEFIRFFAIVLFAWTAIIWTIQAVNFLDLVTEDGHAFRVYLLYSALTIPKILTKLIPFSFLIASILTILKLEKDNELIILSTSGLNKIHIVNLVLRISLLIMVTQLIMSSIVTPKTLNISRSIIKNSQLQFVPSLLKEKQFNDTVEGLTIFVEKKLNDQLYENIFIRDDINVLTKVSNTSSTIFAKSGYIKDKKNLILLNGNIQKLSKDGDVSIIKFEKTSINFSGLSTKTTSEPKIQETSTAEIIECMQSKDVNITNCSDDDQSIRDTVIEMNRRFGMAIFIPLIALVTCFLLSSHKESRNRGLYKYIYFMIGFMILVSAEITVRYSGISINHTLIYYLIPGALLPITYLLLIKKFKYENLG